VLGAGFCGWLVLARFSGGDYRIEIGLDPRFRRGQALAKARSATSAVDPDGEALPSAAMAQLPFGGTPSSLCAESAAMSGSPDRSDLGMRSG
jgi:hypothetical protein